MKRGAFQNEVQQAPYPGFERTISRLEEMRSDEYLEQGHGAH